MIDKIGERYSASDRVCRGGSFDVDARYCRSALRFWFSPVYRRWSLGLRPVITLGLSDLQVKR